MAGHLAGFRYLPVDVGRGELPQSFSGVLFANEFFDALPVDVAVRRGDRFHEMRLALDGGRFRWLEGGSVDEIQTEYLARYCPEAPEGALVEVPLAALRWIEEISRRLKSGYVFAIDYGYVARELARFPRGTLMSYRRHAASEDVLDDPGERDITAHVNFTALEERALLRGFSRERFETLALALLRVGEGDHFAAVLEAPDEARRLRLRLQLKTLLFGMGETFRTLLLRKDPAK
jgi:SAM-dependent MidA family methyltransferase